MIHLKIQIPKFSGVTKKSIDFRARACLRCIFETIFGCESDRQTVPRKYACFSPFFIYFISFLYHILSVFEILNVFLIFSKSFLSKIKIM